MTPFRRPLFPALALLALASAALVTPGAAGSRQVDDARAALASTPVEAICEPRHDLELGFTVRGRVLETLVQPGDDVKAGQPLIRLDDREGEATVRLYTVRAEGSLEIQAAEAEWKLAQNEEARVRDAVAKGGAAQFELERKELETLRARLAYELHQQRREETRLQLEQATAAHERFSLLAPMDGRIEEVLVSPGEMVDEVRPVLRLVVIDPLRIDAPAPLALTASLRHGEPAWVTFRLDGDARAPIQGRIVHIAAVADPGSETRIVRVEIPNKDDLPAGAHVDVFFAKPLGPAAAEGAARNDDEPRPRAAGQ